MGGLLVYALAEVEPVEKTAGVGFRGFCSSMNSRHSYSRVVMAGMMLLAQRAKCMDESSFLADCGKCLTSGIQVFGITFCRPFSST
jgi:hypothetical protein